jgi:hypothetical protein
MATSDDTDGKRFAECPDCGGADFETIDTDQERVWFCVQCSAHLDADENRVGLFD